MFKCLFSLCAWLELGLPESSFSRVTVVHKGFCQLRSSLVSPPSALRVLASEGWADSPQVPHPWCWLLFTRVTSVWVLLSELRLELKEGLCPGPSVQITEHLTWVPHPPGRLAEPPSCRRHQGTFCRLSLGLRPMCRYARTVLERGGGVGARCGDVAVGAGWRVDRTSAACRRRRMEG